MLLAVVGLVLAAPVAAQARRAALVSVTDPDGQPAAGATVTAFGAAWWGELEGPTDVLTATSDDRGRCRFALLGDRAYTAFAVRGAACSGTDELLCAGECELRLGPPAAPFGLEVAGEGAWQEFAPLRFEAGVLGRAAPYWPIAADRSLPPLPSAFQVRVLDGRGEPIWVERVRPWREQDLAQRKCRVDLPAVQDLTVRVKDSSGKPVAEVAIWQEFARSGNPADRRMIREPLLPTRRRVGVSGADGEARLRLPAKLEGGKVWTEIDLVATRAGWANAAAGIIPMGPPYSGSLAIQVPPDQVLPFTLEPPMPVEVVPPGAGVLTVASVVQVGMKVVERVATVPLDAQGKAMLPLRLSAGAAGPLTAGFLALVRVDEPGATAPLWTTPSVPAGAAGASVSRAAREFSVQVVGADGGPPRRARCVVVPLNAPQGLSDIPVPLDGAGRSRIRLGAGTWIFLAHRGLEVAHHVVRVGDAAQSLVLRLQPLPTFTLRCLGVNGPPVAAKIGAVMPHFGLGFSAARLRPEDDANLILEQQVLPSRIASLWPGMQGAQGPEAKPDERGELRVPLLPSRASVEFLFQQQKFTAEPDETVEVTVR